MSKKIKIYQIDAFTETLFRGNPAAVCYLNEWIETKKMQQIAFENNLSETAFIVKNNAFFEIKWFTPTVEVDLCGHATLSAAHVLFNYYNIQQSTLTFKSDKSGLLNVTKTNKGYMLDFPTDTYTQIQPTPEIKNAFDVEPIEIYQGKSDILLIFSNQKIIENIVPDFNKISKIDCRGVIISARGENVDVVSRFFGPNVGVNEDPVTGSAHTLITPVWCHKLNKNKLNAIQLSERKGQLSCELKGERVHITGNAVTYLIGEIEL